VNWRPQMGPPETFQPKVRKQNQIGFWNISSRLTSAASFNKIGWPQFPTSGTLSQAMTLKCFSIFKEFLNPRIKTRIKLLFAKSITMYDRWINHWSLLLPWSSQHRTKVKLNYILQNIDNQHRMDNTILQYTFLVKWSNFLILSKNSKVREVTGFGSERIKTSVLILWL